jgi:asparagine synthase (glutamine-hydrolysing)
MCGLILAPARYPTTKIENALSRMVHRGPDAQSVVKFGNWNLGHVRLAIQDETGEQPFWNEVNQSMAIFVGEFFTPTNIPERDVVKQVLADPSLFHEIDGFWSLVHVLPGVATVYTDHLGIKPTYYWPEHNIVCSELEPMFALEPRPPLDEIYLSNCIKFGYDYSGRTPYQGIIQLPPGHRLVMDDESNDLEHYFKWSLVDSGPSLKDAIQGAITNRLISDRPVAMLLSGGLDSSIIYYTLKSMDRQVEAFAIENGESEFLPEGVVPLRVDEVTVGTAVRVMQAPLDLGSLVPQVQLARAVHEAGYKVCLTGDGADEVFGGYRRAKEYDSQRSDTFCELPYYHMPRLDKVMMASTIELRSPFLSPQVVAFGLRLPHAYRTNKEALKHAFAGVVPHEIIWRPKHPLKTKAVIDGGVEYRRELVQLFRNNFNPEED